VYFIVSLRVYVCDYDRASVSGLLRPFLSFGFYPLNLHSFNCLCMCCKTLYFMQNILLNTEILLIIEIITTSQLF